jgi:phosphoglycolate phosphatase-like HAD superfamily hydrolase
VRRNNHIAILACRLSPGSRAAKMSGQLAIFFDLDGTLVDLNPEGTELERLRKRVLELACSAGLLPETRSIFGIYQQVVREHGFNGVAAHWIRRELDAYETQWVQTRSVLKCDIRLLSELRRRGYRLAIVTNNGMACLRAVFGTKKLTAEWFEFVVTRDNSPLLKPSPMILDRACRMAQQRWLDLYKVWFVGDSETDRRTMDSFNRETGFDFTFAKIGPPLQEGDQSPFYLCLDDFLKEQLELTQKGSDHTWLT